MSSAVPDPARVHFAGELPGKRLQPIGKVVGGRRSGFGDGRGVLEFGTFGVLGRHVVAVHPIPPGIGLWEFPGWGIAALRVALGGHDTADFRGQLGKAGRRRNQARRRFGAGSGPRCAEG